MTELRDVLLLAHRLLEGINTDHALIGAMALANFGVHRTTTDIDLLAEGSRAADIRKALEDGGFQLLRENAELLQFGGIGAVDVLLANRDHSLDMLSRARVVPGLEIKSVGPEDIIGLKIQAYVNDPRRRLQDQADILALIRTGQAMDWDRIREYAELFNEWETVQALKKDSEL